MSSKINLTGGVPGDYGKQEGADGQKRLDVKKAQEGEKKAVTKAIKKATSAPSTVMTGQGIFDMSAEASLEGGLQGTCPKCGGTAACKCDRLADLKKERDKLIALRADAPANRTPGHG